MKEDQTKTPLHSAPIDSADKQYRANELKNNLHPAEWANPIPAGCYNLVVLGGGPAGICAARHAAEMGARVALIENDLLGGDNQAIGSVPSKALIRTSRLYSDIANARKFGVSAIETPESNYPLAEKRKRTIERKLSRMDSAALLAEQGIDLYFGKGFFTSATTLSVDQTVLSFRRALIATGACQNTLDIPGADEGNCTSLKELFSLDELPDRIMFIGGGPLGTELAQAYSRLGSKVFLVHNEPKFLPGEERDAALFLNEALLKDGVEIHLNTQAVGIEESADGVLVKLIAMSKPYAISVNRVVVGVGRSPHVRGLGLDAAGVKFDDSSGVLIDDFLRTSNRRIYAAGDVCLSERFTHAATASAQIAVDNALLMHRKRVSALIIPRCTYTDPEVAQVGLEAIEANQRHIPVRTFTVMMHEVDRAVLDSEELGFVKIHVREGTDRILGATIVARHAGEIINTITLAMQHRLGLRELSKVIHTYPTQAAAIKLAADACARERYPVFLRKLAVVWLKWQRSI